MQCHSPVAASDHHSDDHRGDGRLAEKAWLSIRTRRPPWARGRRGLMSKRLSLLMLAGILMPGALTLAQQNPAPTTDRPPAATTGQPDESDEPRRHLWPKPRKIQSPR